MATLCHLVTDGMGALVLLADLAARDRASDAAAAPVERLQPSALARQQRSPEARQHSEAALRYWGTQLRRIPARRFRGPADPREPRCWQAGCGSPATEVAVRYIAARHGIDTAPVLRAIVAVALARALGGNPVVMQVLVNNRFRPGLSQVVGQVAMWGLSVVDLVDVTLAEAVRRTWRAAITTYKHAYYDKWRLDDLVAAIGRERGEQIDLSCFFNDRRMLAPTGTGAGQPPATVEQVRAARAGFRFR